MSKINKTLFEHMLHDLTVSATQSWTIWFNKTGSLVSRASSLLIMLAC